MKMGKIALLSLLFTSSLILAACTTNQPGSKTTPSAAPQAQKAEKMATYTDQDNLYQFQYPDTFKVTNQSKGKFTTQNDQYVLTSEYITETKNWDSWIEEIREKVKNKDLSVSPTTVGGKEVLAESGMGAGSIFDRNVFVIDNDNIIHISISADVTVAGNEEPEVYTEVEELADQIVRSLEFLQ